MARPIIGLTIEKRRAVIFAQGAIGYPQCVDPEEDCCDYGDIPVPEACCPDLEKLTSVPAVAGGPLGVDGEYCTISWSLERDLVDPLIWEGQGSNVGCGSIYMKLWCFTDTFGYAHWTGAGEWRGMDGIIHKFQKEFAREGDTLTMELIVPEQEDELVIITDIPCPETVGTGTGTGTGTSGGAEYTVICDSCPNPLPTIVYLHLSGATGGCALFNGVTVTMTWDGINTWTGAGPSGSTWAMPCGSDVWRLGSAGSCDGTSFGVENSCSPLDISGTLNLINCCVGSVNWVLNETP